LGRILSLSKFFRQILQYFIKNLPRPLFFKEGRILHYFFPPLRKGRVREGFIKKSPPTPLSERGELKKMGRGYKKAEGLRGSFGL